MGTASSTKVIKNNAGALQELAALTTSAGAADAQALIALNASGLVDDTIMNASAASGANKIVKQNASGIIDPLILNGTVTSAGVGSAAKVVQLDSNGKLDVTVLPTGIGADTGTLTASEALAAGDFVNVWNNSTVPSVRKADASVSGKEADGFVLAAYAAAASALVYFEGTNNQVTGQVAGKVFLSATTAGKGGAAVPTGTGQIVQVIGFAVSATAINFQSGTPVQLA